MSENLSIDEIIRQAEEIRMRTVAKAQSAIDEVKAQAQETAENQDNPDSNEDTVKAYTPTKATSDEPVKKEDKKENIEHTRVVDQKTRPVEISDKTVVINKSENSKKSFFKTTAAEPLYSKEPPEIIEKSATIKSKSKFDKTSDLEEIPTIVAVDELEHTRISLSSTPAPTRKNEEYESDESDQIVLAGFEDTGERVSKIDEELAEEQLKKRREEKINKFRLFSPDEMTDEKSQESTKNEFKKNDDKTAFLERLFATKTSFNLKGILTAVASIPLILLAVFKDSAYLPSALLDYTTYYAVQVIIYLIILGINFKNILYGFKFNKGINFNFPISVASIIVLIHSILLATNTSFYIDGGVALPLVISFAFLMINLGKATLSTRLIENFEFLASNDDKYTVEPIANTVDATIISRGLLTGEPNLKTSIKTDFATNYLDISCSDEPADKIAKTTGVVAMILSAVLFVLVAIIKQSVFLGINTGVCALAISTPVISLFCTNKSLLGVAKELKKNGAMINGFEGASTVNDTNAIVIEAQDLFGKNSCEIHGIKTFNGAKADDVILKTASVIIKTKSPLSYVFDDVIIGKQTILPDVDGVVYEDKLGTSAWIYRKKILVGTRELLIHHGVAVPKEEFEKKYTRKGRKILYLAVTGQLQAMFVVSYNADPMLKRSLKKLEKSGITILVKSADPFINDENIAELFNLPGGFIRVMNSSNARVFEKYSKMCVEKSPAYIVHNGSALGFVSAMAAAENISDTRNILSVIISFGCAVGFVLTAMLGFMEGLNQLNPCNIVIFQLVWCAFTMLVTKIKRISL